jgi:hypothetical protein
MSKDRMKAGDRTELQKIDEPTAAEEATMAAASERGWGWQKKQWLTA